MANKLNQDYVKDLFKYKNGKLYWKTIKGNNTILGKVYSLGRFKDLDDAIKARKRAMQKYEFHANHGI